MKIIKGLFAFIVMLMSTSITWAQVPSFDDFASQLQEGGERVYVIDDISADQSLEQNIRELFYPDTSGNRAILRTYARTIGVGIFVLFIIRNALAFIFNGDDENKIKSTTSNLLSLFIGGLVYFGAVWILGSALNISTSGDGATVVQNIQNKLLFQILALLKAGAFFMAIIFFAYSGIKVMAAMEQEDKIKAGRQGIINVLMALVLLKVIDFVYLIAQQPDFTSELSTLIVSAARIIGWIIGAALVISIIAAGYLFITDDGSGDNAKKAGNMVLSVFFVGLAVFLFLLIVYQLLAQFA